MIEDWDKQYDVSVAPLPWKVVGGFVHDALDRRILESRIISTTRGYVVANDMTLQVLVAVMNSAYGHKHIEVTFSNEDNLSSLQTKVVSDANVAFPDRTAASSFMKLFEEIGEVLKDPRNSIEWADVFIMLLDLADRFGISGDKLAQAIREKSTSNATERVWRVNELGVMQHVENALTEVVK